METTTTSQKQQQHSLDCKIRELNDTLKEYISQARMGAELGNYESSQVFYEGIMHEIEKLISMSKNDADVPHRDALLTSLRKLESELEAVKSLASALEPIRSSLSHTATNGHFPRSSSMQFDPIELPVWLTLEISLTMHFEIVSLVFF